MGSGGSRMLDAIRDRIIIVNKAGKIVYTNAAARGDFDGGLSLVAYVNNLFDENALLSFDRERGGRARLGYNVGQPRTFGITARQKF